jgi:hypothetical protein
MAATGPEGNRGQPSPPGAVFFVAMLIRGPAIVPRMTRFTAGRPSLLAEVSGAAGHHRPVPRAALAAARAPGQERHDDDDDRRDQPGDQERLERCEDPADGRERQPDGQAPQLTSSSRPVGSMRGSFRLQSASKSIVSRLARKHHGWPCWAACAGWQGSEA